MKEVYSAGKMTKYWMWDVKERMMSKMNSSPGDGDGDAEGI